MGTGWVKSDRWYFWWWYFLDIVGNPSQSILSASRSRDRFHVHSPGGFFFKGLINEHFRRVVVRRAGAEWWRGRK